MCGLSIRECHTVNSVLRRRSTLQGKHYHLLHTRYRAYTPSPPASTAVHAKTHFWQASPSSHRHKWGWLLTVRLREAQKTKCLVLQSPHAASKRWTFGCVWKQRPPMKTTVSFLSLSLTFPPCVLEIGQCNLLSASLRRDFLSNIKWSEGKRIHCSRPSCSRVGGSLIRSPVTSLEFGSASYLVFVDIVSRFLNPLSGRWE